jgi:hypothetical protein
MKPNGRSTTRSLLDRDPNAAPVPDPGVKLAEFRALRKLRNHVLGKLQLSIRTARAEGTGPILTQDVAIFVEGMPLRRFCQWSIVNMDEASCKVIENHAYTSW